jgi:hypothetical protein
MGETTTTLKSNRKKRNAIAKKKKKERKNKQTIKSFLKLPDSTEKSALLSSADRNGVTRGILVLHKADLIANEQTSIKLAPVLPKDITSTNIFHARPSLPANTHSFLRSITSPVWFVH